jgi:hypothetical protein
MQDVAAYLVLALAASYLLQRYLRRRASGNCCGEKECPAAKETVRKIADR